jgi:hypothetical protein
MRRTRDVTPGGCQTPGGVHGPCWLLAVINWTHNNNVSANPYHQSANPTISLEYVNATSPAPCTNSTLLGFTSTPSSGTPAR